MPVTSKAVLDEYLAADLISNRIDHWQPRHGVTETVHHHQRLLRRPEHFECCRTYPLGRIWHQILQLRMFRLGERLGFDIRRGVFGPGLKSRPLGQHRGQFPGGGPEAIHGESKTTYANLPQMLGVARPIHETIPDAKLIYAVRDPQRRLVSHYLHVRGLGRERRTLTVILSGPDLRDSAYLTRSRYWYQPSDYLGYFAPSQVFVVSLEEMGADRNGTMRRVFALLKVNPSITSPDWDIIHNASHRYPLLEALGKVASEPTVYDITNNRGGLRRMLTNIWRPYAATPDVDDATWAPAKEILAAEASVFRDFTGQSFASLSV